MKEKKRRTLKREFIEWGIIITVGAVLYITGLHTEVIGTIQGLVLKTGIIRPSTDDVIGRADFNFKLVDENNRVLDAYSLQGKTIYMNFWATWCPPCIAEMPDINQLYNHIEDDDIVFLIVSLDEDFEKAKKFVKKKEYDFNIYQFASSIPQVYSSNAIPTTFVISPNGDIVVKREGMAKYNTESFRNFLQNL